MPTDDVEVDRSRQLTGWAGEPRRNRINERGSARTVLLGRLVPFARGHAPRERDKGRLGGTLAHRSAHIVEHFRSLGDELACESRCRDQRTRGNDSAEEGVRSRVPGVNLRQKLFDVPTPARRGPKVLGLHRSERRHNGVDFLTVIRETLASTAQGQL